MLLNLAFPDASADAEDATRSASPPRRLGAGPAAHDIPLPVRAAGPLRTIALAALYPLRVYAYYSLPKERR